MSEQANAVRDASTREAMARQVREIADYAGSRNVLTFRQVSALRAAAAQLADPSAPLEPAGPQCRATNEHGGWCCLLTEGHDGPHRHDLIWSDR